MPFYKVEVSYLADIDSYSLHWPLQGKGAWDEIKGMVDVIKVTIPASDREYDPATKTWTIISSRYATIEPVLKLRFRIVTKFLVTPQAHYDPSKFFYSYTDPVSTSKETKESLMEKLQKLLGCALSDLGDPIKLKRLYRQKALEYHPDRNAGDGTRMSELNSVWSAYNA